MSHLEEQFALVWRAAGGRSFVAEYRFAPSRRWRFDCAWPSQRVAVELEGGVYNQGRHTRGAGYAADCEKYNTAALLGWVVLRFTARALDDPDAVVRQVQAALAGRRHGGLREQLRAAHRIDLARAAREAGHDRHTG